MAEVAGFVKFFFPDTSSERLPLPVAYSQILGNSTPGVAYLRNSDGQMWQVTIAKEGDNWYFQDGWKELVQTINAEARDLFSFDLADDGIFDFKLFGANRCNKSTSWGQREQVEENNEEVGEEEDAGQEESGGGFRAGRQKKQEQTEKSNNGLSPKKYRLRRRRGQTEEEGNEVGEVPAQLQEEKGQREQQKIDKSHKLSRGEDKRHDCKGKAINQAEDAPPTSDSEEDDYKPEKDHAPPTSDSEEDDQPKERNKSSNSQPRRRKRIAEEESIFQHGVVFRPQNPYFIAKIWERKPCDLCIPSDVVDNYKLQLPAKLVVVDERKREWEAKVRKWGDGRIWISQGWKAFCQVNNMSLEDRCLCEFIQQGEDHLYLRLRILRREGGSSWLPEATTQEEAQKNLQAAADQPPCEDRFFTKSTRGGDGGEVLSHPSEEKIGS